ncbi:MAG: hypothetical protein KatS3mg102_0191 [Planctomycetota bacterium]|nr:MAG: hypothetical protein KatS3mg102_0191 [Planctomycetota bacterium]
MPEAGAEPGGRGTLIALEGPDGAGKTTQARRLEAALRARGFEVVAVREPGGTALGERVRALLLEAPEPIGPRAELFLFQAARAELTERLIRPALAAGRVVIADRFYASTAVYQGAACARHGMEPLAAGWGPLAAVLAAAGGAGAAPAARGGASHGDPAAADRRAAIDRAIEAAVALSLLATGGLVPDLTVVLDLEAEAAAARLGGERGRGDRFEGRGRAWLAAVVEGYRRYAALARAGRLPGRVEVLDAARAPEQLAASVLELALEVLGRAPAAAEAER